MEQWKPPEGFFHPAPAAASDSLPGSCPDSSQGIEPEVKDSIVARKVQKADRERLRRDRLNEQFLELGNALDPDRPKNDKATILTDTVQMLKDLTAQVDRLKAEYTALSEESRELTQEKNEVREEKATLKSDIDSLTTQYQQRLRAMFPWSGMDPAVVMGPPAPYPYAMPVTLPPGPIPMHPSLQPYPFFPNQSAGAVPNPCPAFLSYSNPCNPRIERSPSGHIPTHPQPSSNRSQTSCLQDSRSKYSDHQRSSAEKADDYSNVATDLELKTPGSALPSVSESTHNQESCPKGRKGQQWPPQRKGSSTVDASSSSRCSSSYVLQDSSSNSVGDGSVAEN